MECTGLSLKRIGYVLLHYSHNLVHELVERIALFPRSTSISLDRWSYQPWITSTQSSLSRYSKSRYTDQHPYAKQSEPPRMVLYQRPHSLTNLLGKTPGLFTLSHIPFSHERLIQNHIAVPKITTVVPSSTTNLLHGLPLAQRGPTAHGAG